MTAPWNLHGTCMEPAWNLHGTSAEPPWNLHQSEYIIKPTNVDRGTTSMTHMETA